MLVNMEKAWIFYYLNKLFLRTVLGLQDYCKDNKSSCIPHTQFPFGYF